MNENNYIIKILSSGPWNDEIVEDIKSKLLEKYGESFQVSHLGKRFGTYSNDTVTAYTYPNDNSEIVFTSVLNRNKIDFKDDYYLSLVCYEIKEYITNQFNKYETTVYVRNTIVEEIECNTKISAQEFIDKENYATFMAQIYIKTNSSKELIEKVMEEVKNMYSNIHLLATIFYVDSSYYDEFIKMFSDIPNNEYIDNSNNKKLNKIYNVKVKENNLVISR